VTVDVALGKLDPAAVCVELLHGPVRADGSLSRQRVQSLEPAGATQQGRAYRGTFTC
jgi:hypothetical protein